MHAKTKHITTPEANTTVTVTAVPGGNNHHHRTTTRRRRYICISITITILAVGLLILILALTVFKSKTPTTTVNSVAIESLNATVNLLPIKLSINISISITISVKNPNKVGFTYKTSSAVIRFKGRDIGNIPIPAGKIGPGDTKQMNLTVTMFADRLLTDVDVYGDVISGDLPLSTYTRVSGKVRVLNLFSIHVSSTSTCDLKIDVLGRKIKEQKCHYKNKL